MSSIISIDYIKKVICEKNTDIVSEIDDSNFAQIEYLYNNKYCIFIFKLPENVKYREIQLSNIQIQFRCQSGDAYDAIVDIFVIDNSLENIIGNVGDVLNLNDSVIANNSTHTRNASVNLGSTSDSGWKLAILNTKVYTGTGGYLLFRVGYNTHLQSISFYFTNISKISPIQNVIASDDINDIVPTYPKNINIKNNIAQTFLWQNEPRIEQQYLGDTVYYLPCTSHSVEYRKVGGSSTTLSMTDSNYYQEIPANTFDIDHYEYRVHFYSYDSYELVTPWTPFNAIGQNSAPTINSVSNNAIPTIAWTDQNQAAFEIRIKDSEQNIIYKSGLIAGTAQSYRINKMLSNGTYTVEVRELNIYGLYSEWGSYLFTINPSAVSAPTNIFATVNNKYGVEISGTPAAGATKTYVVRREHGSDDIEIIGIYTGGIYVDYTAKANIFYEYTLRNYNTAYADGEWIPLQIVVDKVLIQDGRDKTNFVKLSLSEDATFDVNWTEEVDRTLYSCLGRKYPVKEPGEWVNSIRTFTAYVDNMDKLRDMNLNAPKVYFKSDKEYFAADMLIEDKGSYVGGGRIVTFTLTRIADDEGITLL